LVAIARALRLLCFQVVPIVAMPAITAKEHTAAAALGQTQQQFQAFQFTIQVMEILMQEQSLFMEARYKNDDNRKRI
jgi:hypothetical protein